MLWKKLEGTQFTYKYYLKKLLGVGGFGAVFSADEVIGDTAIREVAVKIMQVDPDNKKRQLDELVTSTRLKHSSLLDFFSPEQAQIAEAEYWGLVMELATQGSLTDYLKKGTLNNTNLETLVKQVAEGLHYLHTKGIVHRDIKPANILSVDNNWKLADFGIARMLDLQKSMTATSAQMGTKTYMPPESYDGEVRFAWDWWSLGVIIVEAFTGKFAFGEYTTETQLMKKVLMDEPTIPDTLSPSLQEIVKGCLIKDPQQRWSAQQILKALTPIIEVPQQVAIYSKTILNRLKIVQGDITKQRTNAIVNATDRSLSGGGGVDRAIHQAAGIQLLKECKILRGCQTGEAKITKGYQLAAKYIIHTVGPIWQGGNNKEDELLRSCYHKSLQLALQNDLQSVAFPAISTGTYGFPFKRATKIAISEVIVMLNQYPDLEVTFVCFDQKSYQCYREVLESYNL